MLYSDTPRTLVYEDKEDLHYFLGNDSEESLEREFYERLIKRPFISNSDDAQKVVLSVFNNACYICLLIMLESDPTLNINKYMVKAAEGTDNIDLKSHITSATMALVYNWLGVHVNENNWLSIEQIDITLLKQNITNLFSDNITPMPDNHEDFFALLIKDDTLQTNLNDTVINLRSLVDIKYSFVIPIDDVAQGIDYILECYEPEFNNKEECIGFISQIMDRFEEEKSLVTDNTILKKAKMQLISEKRRLKNILDEKPIWDGASFEMLSPDEIDIYFGNHMSSSKQSNNEIITPEKEKYIGWIYDRNKAEIIIKTIQHYMNGRATPKLIIMPIRAAIDAGAIQKPTPKEFKMIFGTTLIKSKSSLNKYCQENTKCYFGNMYKNMVEKFLQIIEEQDSEK